MRTVTALNDVMSERVAQDEQWGGPAHDDTHTPHDWLTYIHKQFRGAACASGLATDFTATPEMRLHARNEARQRFVKIAALAVAAIDSMDRTESQFKESLP